ncbi:hypothetical protein AB0M47_02440 [Hamadaea sp. NPDC051192]|uniref:hypothetical protein n=1 Tax=Hamadaea sp. NPDC051192 TaxID=3154940 RepID=UPI00342C6F98
MRPLAYRLAVLGAIGGMALATTAAATPAVAGEAAPIKGECVIEHVDERGQVVDTASAREGEEYGPFRCADGQWKLVRNPFDRDDAVTSLEIQIDPAGTVLPGRLVGPALGAGMTLHDMASLVQALTGEKVVVDRAIVAVDDGRQRTPEQVRALLAGKDTTGVRVLGEFDRLDQAMTVKDVIDGAEGADPETTVVYFSIWGAIKDAFAWVVKKLRAVGDWLDEHCHLEPSPTGDGADLVCEF